MTIQLNIIRLDGLGEFRIISNVTRIEGLDNNGIRIYHTYANLSKEEIQEVTQVWHKNQIFKMEIIP